MRREDVPCPHPRAHPVDQLLAHSRHLDDGIGSDMIAIQFVEGRSAGELASHETMSGEAPQRTIHPGLRPPEDQSRNLPARQRPGRARKSDENFALQARRNSAVGAGKVHGSTRGSYEYQNAHMSTIVLNDYGFTNLRANRSCVCTLPATPPPVGSAF